jgi:heavy metal translocating P-type ATPase
MGIATLRAGAAGVDALIMIGVAGSLLLSAISLSQGLSEVYFEVPVALITLQLIARMLDLRVRGRARDAVLALLELAPSAVTLLERDGSERRETAATARVGDHARLRAGDSIAVDGRVIAGEAHLDRSLLTGESQPVRTGIGGFLHAGERVLDGTLDFEITAAVGKRRIDGLAKQVRQMLAARPAWQRVADLVARHFLWFSGLAAGIGAAIVWREGGSAVEASVRALAVFVIACPCALSLAAPIVGLMASAAAARQGIVLRDLNAITAGAVPSRVFLDKTGTLTFGSPRVTAVHAFCEGGRIAVLEAAAAAECFVEHPLARAIVSAARASGVAETPESTRSERVVSVTAGAGVSLSDGTRTIRVGRLDWLGSAGIALPTLPPQLTTRAGVAVNGRFVGAIDFEDLLRPGAHRLVSELQSMRIQPVLLSGDAEAPVARVGAALGIEAHSGLSPEQKVSAIAASREQGILTAFAGDGLNDGPALAAADLGIAVGDATDAARTAAAITLVDSDVTHLPRVFRLTRRTRGVLRQSLALAVAYNLLAIPAAVAGWVHPAIAAVAMALSSATIVLNAMRAGRIQHDQPKSAEPRKEAQLLSFSTPRQSYGSKSKT